MVVPALTCVQLIAFKIKEQSTDVLQSVVVRRVHRTTVAEEQVISCEQIKHIELACAKTVAVVAHQDVLLLRDKSDVFVGVVDIETSSKRLIQNVNNVKRTCVSVKFLIDVPEADIGITAVLMQKFVARFQCGLNKQQTSLLFMVVDIGFYGSYIKTILSLGSEREQYQKANNNRQYVIPGRFHLHRVYHYMYLSEHWRLPDATIVFYIVQ